MKTFLSVFLLLALPLLALDHVVMEPVAYSVVAVGTSGAAVTKTVAAATGARHMLDGYAWSLSDVPAAAVLVTISDGSTVVDKFYVTSAGPSGPCRYPRPLAMTLNTALTGTVAAPGGSIVATITLFVHDEP